MGLAAVVSGLERAFDRLALAFDAADSSDQFCSVANGVCHHAYYLRAVA